MMRYHWGLGVGHTYAKVAPNLPDKIAASTAELLDDEGQEIEDGLTQIVDDSEEDNVRDDDELSYVNDSDSENSVNSSDDPESDDDDDEFLELYDTYHP